MTTYVSAQDAARRLGVSRQTLYAYVSRGLLRAYDDSDPRRRCYSLDAVATLAAERRLGRRPKEAAKATLDWGFPVLESALTLIRDGRLYYRGIDALSLARDATVEQVASLLWRLPADAAFGVEGSDTLIRDAAWSRNAQKLDASTLLARFTSVTIDEPIAIGQTSQAQLAEGCAALTRAMLYCVTGTPPDAGPLHETLAKAWRLDLDDFDLVRAALILCADHELAVSNFTARCIASSGASMRAAVIGALAAQSGPRHVGVTAKVETLWRDLENGHIAASMGRHLAAEGRLPGFGHRLYPNGDPRAAYILERIIPKFPQAGAMIATARALTDVEPTLDFALVALRRCLNLPEGTAFCLFAIARTVGWIAHALEQRESRVLIRPRAAYTGPNPESDRWFTIQMAKANPRDGTSGSSAF
jgi:citrate synthase